MTGQRIDYVKYNRERLPQYRTETTIVSSPEGRRVKKRAISPEGVGHIRNVFIGGKLLRERLNDANIPLMSMMDDAVECDFVAGRSFEQYILAKTVENDRTGLIELLKSYGTYLTALGSTKDITPLEGQIGDLLRDVPRSALHDTMPVANLDLTFDNIIIDESGRYWITDHEWVFDSAVPISFIIYRSLYVLYLRQKARMDHVLTFNEALIEMNIDPGLWEPYRQACERFIDMVLGEKREHIIAPHHLKDVHHLASLEDLQNREQTLEAASAELNDTKNALQDMLEHARGREKRLHEQEERLGRLTGDLETQRRELAESDSTIRATRLELDSERLRSLALRDQLDTERMSVRTLNRDLDSSRNAIDLLSNDLREKDIELETLISSNTALNAQYEEQFARLQLMTDQFMSKQAELMTMSDWARSMRTRLDFMESVPTIRRTECMARKQKMALDKIRSDGLLATVKNVVLQSAPPQMQRMFYRQEPSNMDALEDDAEGRDVLVVFPVIPWEFRWQRPQQLVSRFAENGYTVVFVNMTLEPVERRYLNDGEALADVGLGKLREHVYEVRLRSFGKINVYHDRLKGADLNNLARGLGGVLKRLSPRSVTYVVQFPGWGQLAMIMRNRVSGNLVFDCMDDHAGFSNNSSEVVRRETHLMKRSDLVITSSAKLFEKASAFNENTITVRNGTDFDMFNRLSPNGKLDSMRKPIIGYHGAISEWFDPEVVAVTAEKHPEWNFVLIGSTLGCDVTRLKKLSNVSLLGEMPYNELPGYLYYFDVCIIPFRVTPLTMATNPVKFYEYISSGKPVVSVRLPEMVQYESISYLYENQAEFEEGIIAALKESDHDLVAERIEMAKSSSWDQRFQDIRSRLQGMGAPDLKRRKVL